MATGLSIHIGLNVVDPKQYDGWDGRLRGCIADSKAMEDIAKAKGYAGRTLLLDGKATAKAVEQAIGDAAKTLRSGDIFFISYSGHGGQFPDNNNEENDGLDETWVLFDRQFIDDELYALWSRFRPGVRILVLSDSCHSGSVSRFNYYKEVSSQPASREMLRAAGVSDAAEMQFKAMPEEKAAKDYAARKSEYDRVQGMHASGDRATIGASVILISGCQDSQLSGDTAAGGVFTQALLKVYRQGPVAGGYRQFHTKLKRIMPPNQTPNLYMVGAVDRTFERQALFTI